MDKAHIFPSQRCLFLILGGILSLLCCSCQFHSKSNQGEAVAEPTEAVMKAADMAAYQAAVENDKQNMSLKNQAYISFTQPRSGQRFARGTRVKIEAEGWPKNHVRNVVFKVNDKRIGVDASSPFRVTWFAGRPGQFLITAKGRQRGGKTVGAAVSVVVD